MAENKERKLRNSKHLSRTQFLTRNNLLLFGGGLALGCVIGSQYNARAPQNGHNMQYPSGMPRACSCDGQVDDTKHVSLQNLTKDQQELPKKLQKIVGPENVVDGTNYTTHSLPFLKGMRLGQGQALCIVTPRRLKDVYEILPLILKANCTILPQGQNTGLTGGSTPREQSTDTRPLVVLSMKHLDSILPIDDGKRVLCLAGVGLASLDRFLQTHFPDRESHSTLGSTFLNPTTAAGVAYGSGGTQCCRKGPAFTERALYLRLKQNKWKEQEVEIVNTLGIKKFQDTSAKVGQSTKFDNSVYKLDAYTESIRNGYKQNMCVSESSVGPAHDVEYQKQICLSNDKVTRFNADTRGQDCNRSEGKVIVLATVHDTFPKPKATRTFWVGFSSIELALEFRREVALDNPTDLPLSIEYVDRDAFDVIEEAGRVMANLIWLVGPSSPVVRNLWNLKTWVEALPFSSASVVIDKLLFHANSVFPSVLPQTVKVTGSRMNHHVAMSVGDFGDGSMDRLVKRMEKFVEKHGGENVVIHDCSDDVAKLNAFRFVAAPAFRTWCIGNNVQGLSVDYVLPKNKGTPPKLPDLANAPIKRMRYSHFGCNVVHEDVAFAPGVDIHQAKYGLKHAVEGEGGKLPAEHGHGTEYHAPPETQARWKKMDPMNVLNPGVGGLSANADYVENKKA